MPVGKVYRLYGMTVHTHVHNLTFTVAQGQALSRVCCNFAFGIRLLSVPCANPLIADISIAVLVARLTPFLLLSYLQSNFEKSWRHFCPLMLDVLLTICSWLSSWQVAPLFNLATSSWKLRVVLDFLQCLPFFWILFCLVIYTFPAFIKCLFPSANGFSFIDQSLVSDGCSCVDDTVSDIPGRAIGHNNESSSFIRIYIVAQYLFVRRPV